MLAERETGVRRMGEGEVDGGEAGLEDGHGGEVDKLDQLLDGSMVATEVRGDDQRLLRLGEGVGDASDGW